MTSRGAWKHALQTRIHDGNDWLHSKMHQEVYASVDVEVWKLESFFWKSSSAGESHREYLEIISSNQTHQIFIPFHFHQKRRSNIRCRFFFSWCGCGCCGRCGRGGRGGRGCRWAGHGTTLLVFHSTIHFGLHSTPMAHLYIMSAIYVQYVPICPACEEIKTDLP